MRQGRLSVVTKGKVKSFHSLLFGSSLGDNLYGVESHLSPAQRNIGVLLRRTNLPRIPVFTQKWRILPGGHSHNNWLSGGNWDRGAEVRIEWELRAQVAR